MLNSYKFKYQIIVMTIFLPAISVGSVPVQKNDPNNILQKKLAEISSINKGEGGSFLNIETKFLELLADYNSPIQKGKIYAVIALVYSKQGFSSRSDIRVAKATEYCRKALEQPLDAVTSCEMYNRLADSIIVEFWDLPQDQFVQLRQEAIVHCLKGLNIALDNDAPDVLPAPPTTSFYFADPNTPSSEKLIEDHHAEMAARRKWDLDYKFFLLKNALTELLVTLYSYRPYNIDEFRNLGQKYLIGHTDKIDELANKIQDRIAGSEKIPFGGN